MSGSPQTPIQPTVVCYRCAPSLASSLDNGTLNLLTASGSGALLRVLAGEVVDLVVASERRLDVAPEPLLSLLAQAAPDVGLVLLDAGADGARSAQLLRAGPVWSLSLADDDPAVPAVLEALAAREAVRLAARRSSRVWASWTRATQGMLEDVLHELRTPISIVQGYVANLLDELDGPLAAPQRLALERVREASALLVELASGLRDRLPTETGPHTPVPNARRRGRRQLDLGALVSDTVALFERKAVDQGVALDSEQRGPIPPVWADRARLTQLLVNVLSNALRFTPTGGIIRVTLEPDSVQGRSGCRLRVRDTGPGVPPPLRERIFERGVSGDPDRPGLGLAIARQVALEHRAELLLLNDERPGACFELRLPADPRRRPIVVKRIEDAALAETILLKLCAEQAPPRPLEPEERDADVLVARLLDGALALLIDAPEGTP